MTNRSKEKLPTHHILLAGDDIGWWGWTVDPVPTEPVRMHLRRFTGEAVRLDLEGPGGLRALEPSIELPVELETRLALYLARLRPELEARWLDLIRGWGWIRFEGSEVEVYPGSPLAFTRSVPLGDPAQMSGQELAEFVWWR